MKKIHRTKMTAWIWLFIGGFLLLYSIYFLSQFESTTGPFKAGIIGLAFGVLCLSGGAGLLRSHKWAKALISLCAGLFILYSLSYFLMGGDICKNSLYTSIVTLFLFISIYTFWGIREHKSQQNASQL
jgi:uncharacterized membrane protein